MVNTDSFEYYSDLEELGRCGVACANKAKRMAYRKYPNQIPDGYLYNRCHLIAYQLTGENTNEKNLITGTRNFGRRICLDTNKRWNEIP